MNTAKTQPNLDVVKMDTNVFGEMIGIDNLKEKLLEGLDSGVCEDSWEQVKENMRGRLYEKLQGEAD